MPTSLRSLSDEELLDRTHALVADERKLTLRVLLYLNEIESRKLHLTLGHGSLFDYCTTTLGYSSSAAGRRIQTARCVARFPAMYGMLERNEVNLSTVAQISRVLDESNHAELLPRIARKSQREVEVILADYQPPIKVVERARTVVMRVPASHAKPAARPGIAFGLLQPSASTAANADACEKSDYSRNGSESADATRSDHLEKRVMLQFSVQPDFMSKLARLRTIAWYRLPVRASFEEVFEFLLDEFIERHDPASKQKRREQKQARSATVTGQLHGRRETLPAPSKRYIPAALRDQVFQRDNGHCSFVGANGTRCKSTLALQIDHIVPVALGGSSTPDNLRLLCAKHNRLEAERMLGRAGVATSKPERSNGQAKAH